MPETKDQRRRGPRSVPAPPDAPAPPADAASVEALEQKIDTLADQLGNFIDLTQQAHNNLAESMARALTAQDERIVKALEHPLVTMSPEGEVSVAAEAAPAVPPSDFVSEVGEGTIRFMSPIANYRIIVDSSATLVVNNRPVTVPQKMAEFNHGILDVDTTTDEGREVAEFLLARKEFGEDYFVDPTAKPRMGPEIVDGARSTGGAPRAAQPSPPTVTETGELTVRL